MNLRGRLVRVERALAVTRFVPGCPTCGFPSPHGQAVYLVEEPEDDRRCERCGNLTDRDGHTIGQLYPDGRVVLQRITLCSRGDPVPIPVESES